MGNTLNIDLYPTICNLCGGEVVYISNANIYGKPYGSGYCYFCTKCGGYVGTHKPRPKEAFGIIANSSMRKAKRICHDIFDKLWKTRTERQELYKRLADEMGIPFEYCHFGYFNMYQLRLAYTILKGWEEKWDS